jgi:hypothetical protein
MENTIKIERLNAAAEKAEKTINRAQNWEANRNNAAARLFAINAAAAIIEAIEDDKNPFDYCGEAVNYLHGLFIASFNAQIKARAAFEASFSAIKNAATPAVLAAAVNSRGFQFDAAIRGCYQAIKAAATLERAEKWEKVTSERAERAAERAAELRAKIG